MTCIHIKAIDFLLQFDYKYNKYKKQVNLMTASEIKKEVKDIRNLSSQIKGSPEKARELLQRTGMYTEKGNLKRRFK